MGINCSLGPRRLVEIVSAVSKHTDLPLSVQPDAGKPLRSVDDSRLRFDLDVEYFASFAPRYVEAGCVLLGGCCGTTPAMIRALAGQARDLKPTRSGGGPAKKPRSKSSSRRAAGEPFDRRLASDHFLIGVELITPRPSDLPAALATASRLHQRGVDFFGVSATDGREGRISPMSFAAAIRERTGAELVHSLGTQGRSLIGLQAGMLGASAMNVNNIVCLDVDPSSAGRDHPVRESLWETDPLGQVSLLAGLNEGKDCHGFALGTSTAFLIGARCDLGRDDLEAEAGRISRLLDAGARFLTMGPVYETETVRTFLEAIPAPRPPTLVTIKPLRDLDEAEQLFYEERELHVPPSVLDAMAGDGGSDHRRGVALAEKLVFELRSFASGVLLSVDDDTRLDQLLAAVLADARTVGG